MPNFVNKIGAGVCLAAALSSCAFHGSVEPFDESRVVLMQLTDMQQGENIGVISTSEGEFTIRFFPSEAPKAVETFISLAQSGEYDGQPLLPAAREKISEEGDYLLAPLPEEIKKKVEPFKAEFSYNLCPFPGAVSMEVDNRGRANGGFLVAATNTVSEGVLENLEKEGYPKVIAQAFRERGGYPQCWLTEPVFAQVIEGQPVVDKISEKIREGGRDVLIEKVSIERYSA